MNSKGAFDANLGPTEPHGSSSSAGDTEDESDEDDRMEHQQSAPAPPDAALTVVTDDLKPTEVATTEAAAAADTADAGPAPAEASGSIDAEAVSVSAADQTPALEVTSAAVAAYERVTEAADPASVSATSTAVAPDSPSKVMTFHEKRSQDAWVKRLQELKAYQLKFGTTLVPLTAEHQDYRSLARWANNKRLQFHKNQLPAHEKEALDELGFEWKQTRNDVWDEYFQHLRTFQQTYGHTRVSGDYQYVIDVAATRDKEAPELVPLRNWCRTQRMRFRKNTLPAERMAQLDSVGFNWVTNGEAWNRLFQGLAVCYRNQGHFQIPQDTYLGKWAARLPLHKNELRKDQLDKLATINFDWTPRLLSKPPQKQSSKTATSKRTASDGDDQKPAAKRQARADTDQELAMPSITVDSNAIPAASHHPLAMNSFHVASGEVLETSVSSDSRTSAAARIDADRHSILLALQAQTQSRGPLMPLQHQQYMHAVPSFAHNSSGGLPRDVSGWAVPSLSSPARTASSLLATNHQGAGALSTDRLLEELRRRVLMEDLQRQQVYEGQLQRQDDLRRLQQMEAALDPHASHTQQHNGQQQQQQRSMAADHLLRHLQPMATPSSQLFVAAPMQDPYAPRFAQHSYSAQMHPPLQYTIQDLLHPPQQYPIQDLLRQQQQQQPQASLSSQPESVQAMIERLLRRQQQEDSQPSGDRQQQQHD
jgi:hypothetical protein